ncbi:MAG: hypothetical protein FWF68_05025 [Spirochaetes bacterium]|nr:hypothetical protein [Spirochaetota bacterium]
MEINKHILFYLFLIASIAVLPAQTAPNAGQTAWYKQTAVVDQNKNRSNGDNTGQFIAFTKTGCYDSNKEGYDIGNGFLEYKGLENNIHVYYGNTFWGKGSYFFNNDFSKLNIRTDTGIVYVYEKTAAPASAVTSAKITQKSAPAANTSPVYTPPSVITPSSPGGGMSVGNRVQCNSCRGTGNCSSCNGNYILGDCTYCNGKGKTIYGYGTNATYETCVACKGSGKKYCAVCYNPGGINHNPGKCSVCKGSGYINY